jgi:hypothetical protein
MSPKPARAALRESACIGSIHECVNDALVSVIPQA